MPTTYLLTGANRGIGLEFARQLSRRGRDTVLITTARKPHEAKDLTRLGIEVHPLDVSDESSINELASRLSGLAIDVLINNAGVGSEQAAISKLELAELQRVFMINTFAPILLARSLLPCLRAGQRKTIFNITSQLGSIGNNKGGSSYAYRGSKSALNQLTVSLSNELKADGFCCVVAHPGWVKTDMGGEKAPLTPEQSVNGLLSVLDKLKPANTGTFYNYDGSTLPW